MNVRFGSEIAAAAAAEHIDPRLLAAVAAQETGGPGSDSGRNIVGDGGHGRGVFQIDDRFWSFARGPAAMDPARNAAMAAAILASDLRRSGGDVHAALSAYNSGSLTALGSTTRWGDGAVLGYADSVMRHYTALGGSQEGLAAETRGTLASLDALREASRGLPGGSAWTPAASWGSQGLSLGQTASTPFQTWTQMTSSSADETAAADRAVADLVGAGDLDDTSPGDDDSTELG